LIAVLRWTGLIAFLTALLAGCSLGEQYYEDVDEVGKKIVADWKALPEVAEARHDYRHGIDQGQIMYVIAIIRADSVSEELIEKLKEVAERDYWLGTARKVSLRLVVYSSDNPPVEGGTDPDRAIRRETIGLPEKIGLEKYGPRPTKK
jgi:hypothetical protein